MHGRARSFTEQLRAGSEKAKGGRRTRNGIGDGEMGSKMHRMRPGMKQGWHSFQNLAASSSTPKAFPHCELYAKPRTRHPVHATMKWTSADDWHPPLPCRFGHENASISYPPVDLSMASSTSSPPLDFPSRLSKHFSLSGHAPVVAREQPWSWHVWHPSPP